MINLAEVEYLNSCFNTNQPPPPPQQTTEEILDFLGKLIGESFKGFVLTVVDDEKELYLVGNLDEKSSINVLKGALATLEEDYKGF